MPRKKTTKKKNGYVGLHRTKKETNVVNISI